jgi:hypothetical protein
VDWTIVEAQVQPGHQVASGRGSSPYPAGTIALQTPCFQALGLDLTPFYPATLNLDLSPYEAVMQQPALTFRQVDWTPAHPPEDFSFSPCRLRFHGIRYDGWVYYPHPATKTRHFQNSAVLEVLAPEIPGIGYGDRLTVELNPTEILLRQHP